MAVSNVHLVPAAWDHDTFHQIKNPSVSQTLSVKISYYLNYVSFISNTSFVCENCKSAISKNWFLVLTKTKQQCAAPWRSILASIFEIKFLPVCLIFNVKLLLLYCLNSYSIHQRRIAHLWFRTKKFNFIVLLCIWCTLEVHWLNKLNVNLWRAPCTIPLLCFKTD